MTALLLAVRFGTELALFVLLAVVGAALGEGLVLSVALAALLPAVAIAVWAMWVAPKASRRLADPARLLVELALFAVAAVGLALVGYDGWALVFILTASGAAFLVRRFAAGA